MKRLLHLTNLWSGRGRRAVWATAALCLATTACNLGAKKAGPSAREDCARVGAVTEAEHKKLPSAEQLGTTRAEVNAAKAVRDYAAKLDAVPVNDKELNNKLADYGDHLRKMAKALDELWTASESEKASYAAKAQKVVNDEYAFVNEINAYCQGAR